jgi:HEAT repeat protein
MIGYGRPRCEISPHFLARAIPVKLFGPNITTLEKSNNVPELLKCLGHKRADVRYRAFAALAARNDAGGEIADRLRKMVNDPDPWVKTIASLKFAGQGDASLSDDLLEIIRKGPQKARIELLKIIAGRGPDENITNMQIIMDGLADKKEIVKRQAIIAAGATGNSHLVPYLAECLQEKHHDLRVEAAKALYDIGGSESIDHLIGLLADEDPEVQAVARSYLATFDDERARKALNDTRFMQLVRGMNGTEPVRRETAQKIGCDAIREGLPLLHRACRDKYKGVRIEALKAMAVFRNRSSIDFAAGLVHDKYHDVRLEAVKTLENIIDTRSLQIIENALNDRDKQVRETARRAYDRMKRDL